MASADDLLITNLERQLKRLVEQLDDLEANRDELPPKVYDNVLEDTKDQLQEFTERLDRMQNGNLSLESKVTAMRTAITQAVSKAFNTVEMIKFFGDQSANDIGRQLLQLDEDFHLKKLTKAEFEEQKIQLLQKLKSEGRAISSTDAAFLQSKQDNDFARLEQIEGENDS